MKYLVANVRREAGSLPGPLGIAGMLILYGALAVLGMSSYLIYHRRQSLPAGHPGRMSAAHLEEA